MAEDITIVPNQAELEAQFALVHSMIEKYRSSAISMVNVAALQMNWEIGQYISMQLKSARWGTKVVSDLADYLKRISPKRRGFGKRNLYNMVKFYDTYSSEAFRNIVNNLQLPDFVQSKIAQSQNISIVQTLSAQIQNDPIVQLASAQLEPSTILPLPKILTATSFSNHVEIMNRCHNDEERIFYMLFARHR